MADFKPTTPVHDWLYPAQLVRVIDGDTVICNMDAGMFNYRVERLRLAGLNAPELKTPEGVTARQFVQDWMDMNRSNVVWPLLVRTQRTDDYGRWVATLWAMHDGSCLNKLLLDLNLAKPYP